MLALLAGYLLSEQEFQIWRKFGYLLDLHQHKSYLQSYHLQTVKKSVIPCDCRCLCTKNEAVCKETGVKLNTVSI